MLLSIRFSVSSKIVFHFHEDRTSAHRRTCVNAIGGCEEDVKHRIRAAWQNLKDMAGVV